MTMPDETPRNSIVMYRVGGRAYPLKSNGNCKVCRSPDRMDIEQAIINGLHYATIANSLSEESTISARNINDHAAKHLPLAVEAMRGALDERARVRGIGLEDYTRASLIDPALFAQTVVDRTYEALANGYMLPTISNALKAATLLYNIGLTEENLGQEDMIQAFAAFMEAAEQNMTPTEWDAFGAALFQNPFLRGLKNRRDAAAREREQGIASIEGGSRED